MGSGLGGNELRLVGVAGKRRSSGRSWTAVERAAAAAEGGGGE